MPNNYDIYVDDSSEDEIESESQYSLLESFKTFYEKHGGKFPTVKNTHVAVSFASHALGIFTLDNSKSRSHYRDTKGYLIGLDNPDNRNTEFTKYITKVIDMTIKKLCLKALKDSESKDDSAVDSASESIFTMLSNDSIINTTIKKCLKHRKFYKCVAKREENTLLYLFDDFIDALVDCDDTLLKNASDKGAFEERCLFKSWDGVVTYQYVKKVLMIHLKYLQPRRETFPASVILQNRNAETFIANILKTQCSDKRRTKNLKDFDLYGMGQQETCRTWFFKALNSSALERSIIGRNSKNRSSWIANIEGYEDILRAIDNIKASLIHKYSISFTDAQLAKAIRNNLNGLKMSDMGEIVDDHVYLKSDKEQLSELVASLTQLFFGLETVRNPSSIIINQMVLDLIIEYDYSFQQMLARNKNLQVLDLLDSSDYYVPEKLEKNQVPCILGKNEINEYRSGGAMPMSHVGVMAIARKLEAIYQLDNAVFMPKPYCYKGSKQVDKREIAVQNESELTRLEAKIVNTWLVIVKNEQYLKVMRDVDGTIMLLESTVDEYIKTCWFNDIEIDQTIHMKMNNN